MSINIAVLGLGPMGQALAAALLDAGHHVTVWNRTAGKDGELTAQGAVAAGTPAAAVSASDLTLVNVVDHDAVDTVLSAVGPALAGATIVGLSSDTPQRAQRTADLVAQHGGRYLDGAIMTPVDTIGGPHAAILFAGPQEIFDSHRAVFAALGTPTWLGGDPGRAAGFDVALLDLFWTSMGGFLHALGIARAGGIGAAELLPHALGIVEILTPIFTEIAERVEADRHDDASASVSSVAASLRHLIRAGRDAGLEVDALSALQRRVDAEVAAGHGAREISWLAK